MSRPADTDPAALGSSFQARIRALAALGFEDGDLVKLFPEASERAVRRWRGEHSPKRPGARWEQLDDLWTIVRYLRDDARWTDAAVLAWPRTRHADLGYARPLDALGAGRFHEVFECARSAVAAQRHAPVERV